MATPDPRPPRVFSYQRCSTPEQRLGDSFRRQEDAAAEFARRNGLQLDTELKMLEPGRSAYSGAHLDPQKSALGKFLNLAADGLVPRGSVLLVEDVSRLTRMAWYDAVKLLTQLVVGRGIEVLFLDSGTRYTPENIEDVGNALSYVIKSQQTREESSRKARHLRKRRAVERTWAAESGRIATRMLPSWLTVKGDQITQDDKRRLVRSGGRIVLVPKRAALVRRMFDMFLAGDGKHAIAETFNTEKVPTWGAHGEGRKAAVHWHSTYIFKCLTNPAAKGTWVPYVKSKVGKREPQEPIPNYFPAAVDAETWERAQALITARRKTTRAAGVASIVAGLARCPHCGGTMTRVSKGDPAKAGAPKLVCVKAKNAAGCIYHGVKLPDVERALTANADGIAAASPITDASVFDRIREVEAQIAAKSANLDKLFAAFLDSDATPPKIVTERLTTTEAERDALKLELEDLKARQRHSESEYVALRVKRMAEALKALANFSGTVAECNAALREVFSSIVIDYDAGQLVCHWLHGPPPVVVPFG